MEENNYMGKWELACIVFNCLVYKIFTPYSENFESFGGSAAWLTALFSGAVFLLILWFVLKIYSPYADDGLLLTLKYRSGRFAYTLISFIAIIWFVFGIGYAAYAASSALKMVVYINSPFWFIILFFAIGALGAVICGERAVRRLHSLNALGVGFALIAISLLSLRYADIYNMTPILGKGTTSVFGKGLSTLFIYSDIVVIFFLPKRGGDYSFKKTVMWSAAAAVLVNIIVVTAFTLNMPFELAENIALPIYPLTKTANLGKFPARLDSMYQVALISSVLLYISLALHIAIKCLKSVKKKSKIATAVILCIAMCTSLCGCYDSKEVEEKAYIIALGVDNGETEKYRYTFQISNPLESGGSIGTEEKAAKNSSGSDEGNKTVDNIVIEAYNYHIALDRLKSVLSKEADMSHIKLIVYSFDIAESGAMEHSELLLSEREIRPGTNLCLADSAEKFLVSVKPTLEESTVRYYELYLRNYNIPYAPVTELRDFVGRSKDNGYDAVVPISGEDGLSGMGIFADGILKEKLSGEEVFIYKMLCGDLNKASASDGENGIFISNSGNPKIKIKNAGNTPNIEITLTLKIEGDYNSEALVNMLKSKSEDLLYKISSAGCDILGIGRYLKKNCLTQDEWLSTNWNNLFENSKFSLDILTEKTKITEKLQNS